MSEDREELNQEKQATESDEARTVSINLSWGSTKMCSVRKFRTSILKSSKYMLMLEVFIISGGDFDGSFIELSNDSNLDALLQYYVHKLGNAQLTADGSENSHLPREKKKSSTCRKFADDTLRPSPLEVSMC
jgi:hypothetical protein